MYSKAFHLVKHTPSGSFLNTLMEGLTVTAHYIVLKLMALKYCVTQTKFTVFKPTQKGAIPPKAINSTLIIQAIPRLTVDPIVEQTLKSSRLFCKDLRFLIHFTTRSSTLNPFPPLRNYGRLNYFVNMKTDLTSFHLHLYSIDFFN